MLNLSKYFNTLIHKNKEEEKAKSYRLGFSVLGVEGEPVEAVSGIVPKEIVRVGDAYNYVVGYGLRPLSGPEIKVAEETKAKIVDILAEGPEEISPSLFDKARELALSMLSEIEKTRATYLAYILAHDTVGVGPISILLEDKMHIEEIEINSPRSPLLIHHSVYGLCQTNLRIEGDQWFRHYINKMAYQAEKELGEETPIIDAQIEDARLHAQIKPYAQSGGAASIRIGSGKSIGIEALVKANTASEDVLAYLWLALDSLSNIVISGAPASGKTTLLNSLLSFIPPYKRTITIEEDINELRADGLGNIVALYGSKYGKRIEVSEQVINALRMRPDIIIVGETRCKEARELFAGANLGVPFITTMHSNGGALEIINRLLVEPMSVDVRSVSMLDVAVYMRQADVRQRVLDSIYEYHWLSRGEAEEGIEIGAENSLHIEQIVKNGILDRSALLRSKVIAKYAKLRRISAKQAIKEFERRSKFIKEAVAKGNVDSALRSYG